MNAEDTFSYKECATLEAPYQNICRLIKRIPRCSYFDSSDNIDFHTCMAFIHRSKLPKSEIALEKALYNLFHFQENPSKCNGYNDWTPINLIKEFPELSKQMNYIMGEKLRNGTCVEQNYDLAFKYFKKSFEEGYPPAYNSLAFRYKNGQGTKRNLHMYFSLLSGAANLGYPLAQNFLGLNYRDGDVTEKNIKTAIYFFEKATESGDKYAPYNLGKLYYYGQDVVKVNKDLAIRYYKIAAERHHKESIEMLEKLKVEGEYIVDYNCPYEDGKYCDGYKNLIGKCIRMDRPANDCKRIAKKIIDKQISRDNENDD